MQRNYDLKIKVRYDCVLSLYSYIFRLIVDTLYSQTKLLRNQIYTVNTLLSSVFGFFYQYFKWNIKTFSEHGSSNIMKSGWSARGLQRYRCHQQDCLTLSCRNITIKLMKLVSRNKSSIWLSTVLVFEIPKVEFG